MSNKKIPLNVIPLIESEEHFSSYQRQFFDFSSKSDLSLYIHFPFCLDKCVFCPIKTKKYNSNLVKKYLFELKREIVSILNNIRNSKVDNIHFGGGTPSLLKVCELDDILNTIQSYVDIENAEITFEAHPTFITDEMMDYLSRIKNCTINFGVQSFDDIVLESMNRHCNSICMIRKICLAKEKNNKVGIDYICDWSSSNYKSIDKDIRAIKLIQPEHISQYPLREYDVSNACLHDSDTDDRKIKLNQYCESKIVDLGYQRYSISHYQKKGNYSHRYGRNQLYGGEWLGIGANAYSYSRNCVYINPNVSEYINGNFVCEQNILNPKDRLIWELIFLFRIFPLQRKEIVEKYGLVIVEFLDEITKIFYDKGYVVSEQNLSLTWRGIINIDFIEKIINEKISL